MKNLTLSGFAKFNVVVEEEVDGCDPVSHSLLC